MNKEEILTCLLYNTEQYINENPFNTTTMYEIALLKCVRNDLPNVSYNVKSFKRILPVLEKDGYDISHFFLKDSAEPGYYSFMSLNEREAFDVIHYSPNDIRISYMDEGFNYHTCSNIAEAVSLYHIHRENMCLLNNTNVSGVSE